MRDTIKILRFLILQIHIGVISHRRILGYTIGIEYHSILIRKWQPTPVFLHGESHGPRSLVGYSPWGRKESDFTLMVLNTIYMLMNPKFISLFQIYTSFPGGSDGKASACNSGDLGSIPGLRRSPGEGNGNPLQYSCLENPMDRGAL